MACTRDDICKMNLDRNEQDKGLGYMLNVPGNGS